jgi:hypothetical protein
MEPGYLNAFKAIGWCATLAMVIKSTRKQNTLETDSTNLVCECPACTVESAIDFAKEFLPVWGDWVTMTVHPSEIEVWMAILERDYTSPPGRFQPGGETVH